MKYFAVLPADAKPPLDLNKETMERYRAEMSKFYTRMVNVSPLQPKIRIVRPINRHNIIVAAIIKRNAPQNQTNQL